MMSLLTRRFDPAGAPHPRWPWIALLEVGVAALLLVGAGLALGTVGPLGAFGRAAAGGALQAALLAAGWVLAGGEESRSRGPALWLGAVVIAAALASHAHRWGAVMYLAVPLMLVEQVRRRPELARIGVGWPGFRAVALGLAIGSFLGVHLLVTASLTFGYGVRVSSVAGYLAAAAYDVGANALTAEWLFRGALFSRWWREWSFWPAAGASTGCALVRYLADPNLPRTVEVAFGAVFYLTLLGVSACAFRARTGSLLPGYAASLAFFLGYRTLSD